MLRAHGLRMDEQRKVHDAAKDLTSKVAQKRIKKAEQQEKDYLDVFSKTVTKRSQREKQK